MDQGARPHRVALIEVLDAEGRAGRVGRVFDVAGWPLTIGRAIDNHLVLDDPWVAPEHARVVVNDAGALELQVLPGRNGVLHDGKRLGAGDTLALAADAATTLQLGATRLRLRLPGEVLVPERPLPGLQPGQRAQALALLAALLALLLAGHWVDLDPGADYTAWLPLATRWPLAAAAWCGAWALASKLFQHRFDFAGHARVALPWVLAIAAFEIAWPQLTAALALPMAWRLGEPLQALLGALLVRAHLAHVLPQHHRAVTAGIAALLLVGGTVSMALNWRRTDSLLAEPYMSTLPPPALRWAGSAPPAALVQDIAPLAAKLAERVKKARDDDRDAGDDGNE